MVKVAVLGYGTVGSGVVEVFNTNRESINKKAGQEINVKYVLDLREFPGDPVMDILVHDYNVILNDPEIEVIAEVMGGVEPAYTFVKAALEKGKSVCTSNKELVAKHGPELLKIAREHNRNFLFEASVGGGIPIIRPLNQSLTADEITKITGILNGTTNYILTKMSKEGLDFDTVLKFCEPVKKLVDMGVEVAIVVGGGNFWRGRSSGQMDRTRADHMGMLATVINALGVADALEQFDLQVRVQTAISMQQVAEPYIRNRAVRHLEKGRVVVFGCGTGNPFFSTDTAAALRAAEIEADIILKATMVDGVYDSDPKKNPDAKKFKTLTFQEVLNQNLGVMDSTAAAICKDNNIPIIVFSLDNPQNIVSAVCGEDIGTLVE